VVRAGLRPSASADSPVQHFEATPAVVAPTTAQAGLGAQTGGWMIPREWRHSANSTKLA
jgi:hypothetical protein